MSTQEPAVAAAALPPPEPAAKASAVSPNEQPRDSGSEQQEEKAHEDDPGAPGSLEQAKAELLAAVAALDQPGSAVTPVQVLSLLEQLGQRAVSPAQLKSTGIGIEVAKLKKYNNAEIKVAAQEVIVRWKNAVLPSRKRPLDSAAQPSLQLYPPSLVDPAQQTRKRQKGSPGGAQTPDFIPLSRPAHEYPDDADRPQSSSQVLRARLDKIFPDGHAYRLGATGEKTRDKIQELLAEALKDPAFDNHVKIAVRLEAAMFLHFDNTGSDYKDKYRTIILNLRDPNNPDINQRLLEGQLTPETAVLLHPNQLASAALQEQRDERLKEIKAASRSDLGASQAMTDQFVCGKCKQNRTTYYQQQTRSADEPMTTFVMCCNCGNRWKF